MNLQGLIFKKIEHRIIAGTVAFLAMMAIIGWIAINEPGRMASFEQQYLARSIERGAALFSTNCTECHGTDGRGVVGRAPALNSPYLFGHDFYGAIDRETSNLESELNNPNTTEERRTEIQARLTELQAERAALAQQLAAVSTKPGFYDPETPSRMTNLGWASTLYNFVYTTLVHGRPSSSSYWGLPMAAWIQTGGGPLRPDEGQDIVNYILNWDKGEDWTVEDLLAVNQFPIRPVDPATVVSSGVETIGTDVAAIVAELPGFQGDPQNGLTLYQGALGCLGCHGNAVIAPPTEGTWSRVQEVRLQDPAIQALLPEQTGEAYLAFSIVLPHDYLVPPYGPVMPTTFGAQLTYQDLADLIAYLQSQDQPAQ